MFGAGRKPGESGVARVSAGTRLEEEGRRRGHEDVGRFGRTAGFLKVGVGGWEGACGG